LQIKPPRHNLLDSCKCIVCRIDYNISGPLEIHSTRFESFQRKLSNCGSVKRSQSVLLGVDHLSSETLRNMLCLLAWLSN
jgi:hypothetical protein